MASQNYPRITSSYESIATYTVGAGGVSTVTFSSIPSTFKHLQIRALVRGTVSAASDAWYARYNSDSGSNYYGTHILYGTGSTAGSYASGTQTQNQLSDSVGSTATANTFATSVTDILDYASTNKYKTQRTLYGYDVNGSGTVALSSGLWLNTSAISTILLAPSSGNFAQYSSFALYGIRG
jgi:hypothetical protein